MEITEGNVRVFERQAVTIGDETIAQLSLSRVGLLKIERELIALAKKVDEQRTHIHRLGGRHA